MPRIAFVVLLAALAGRPAGAGLVLYATAATVGRIDAFCLGPNGGLAGTPRTQIDLASPNPRRLLVVNGVLYVAEPDRVEAFLIPPDGRLSRDAGMYGSTNRDGSMDARDIAVSGGMLYVTQRGRARVAAYPLGPDGLPQQDEEDFTSCVVGPGNVGYQHVLVDGTSLYVSSDGSTGNRVDVFDILAGGQLCTSPDCTTDALHPLDCRCKGAMAYCTTPCKDAEHCPDQRPANFVESPPVLQRRSLDGPKSLLISDGTLFVEEQSALRISGFAVAELQPPPPTPAKGEKKPKPAPARSSKTIESLRYVALERNGSTLFGTQFGRGRTDVYRLRNPGSKRCPTCPTATPCCLTQNPTQSSKQDLRMSPVGLEVAQVGERQVLYVAAGDWDRVLAYRLNTNGLLASRTPFSTTAEQAGSFPNDVAVAVLSAGCP
jgi:hypothetical protein